MELTLITYLFHIMEQLCLFLYRLYILDKSVDLVLFLAMYVGMANKIDDHTLK